MVDNMFRQALNLIETKPCGEFTEEDSRLINEAIFPLLIRWIPGCDEIPITEGLERLAKLVEGGKQ